MKESAKARRLKRHYRRNKSQGKMNLVSLMDIFTILVFFLMVNSSSDVQVLNQNSTIKLPDSTAQQPLPEAGARLPGQPVVGASAGCRASDYHSCGPGTSLRAAQENHVHLCGRRLCQHFPGG